MDITTGPRDKGSYVIRTTGMQKWPEGDGTWQAPGVRLDLMDGRRRLAVCTLEVPQSDAEERGAFEAERIEPWVRTLRYLATVRDLRDTLAALESLILRAEEEQYGGWKATPETAEELLRYATQDEVDAARAAGGIDPLGAALGRLVAARLGGQIAQGLRAGLAFAPDPTVVPIHPAWEQPGFAGMAGESTAQVVARDLLAAWADTRDLRDPLITWAVNDAGLTRSEVQQTTSVSRSTINRLLP